MADSHNSTDPVIAHTNHTHTLMRTIIRPFLQLGILLAHQWRLPDAINSCLSAEWEADGHLVLFCLTVVRQGQCPPQSLFMYVHISTLSWGAVELLTDGGLSVNGSMLVGGVSFESMASLCQHQWLQFSQFEGFKRAISDFLATVGQKK